MIVAGKKANNSTSLEVTYDMRSRKDLLVATFWKDAVGGGVLGKNWVDIEIPSDPEARLQMVQVFAAALGVPLSAVNA